MHGYLELCTTGFNAIGSQRRAYRIEALGQVRGIELHCQPLAAEMTGTSGNLNRSN